MSSGLGPSLTLLNCMKQRMLMLPKLKLCWIHHLIQRVEVKSEKKKKKPIATLTVKVPICLTFFISCHRLRQPPYLFCPYVDDIFGLWVLLPQRGSRRVFQERYHGLVVRKEVKISQNLSEGDKKCPLNENKHFLRRSTKKSIAGKSKCRRHDFQKVRNH